ncbi:hypothetical protein APHCR_0043 [Anaplasma phagocytophilum str. CR1007]|uniref:Uncharacterized protein n=1 Tax=Anaplasma phagocytophilum str. NCH-1 TaxID=1359161 RepID=A0A0F3NFZ5_ANAPH|nr:hypothetical protein EPHNCH_0826 [Anaplasma phagocytophilum str. NCH-1]KJZ99587.1 hypothetical protein APHCR_0043 [Anaplasma phagocytophilum str. CR1007]
MDAFSALYSVVLESALYARFQHLLIYILSAFSKQCRCVCIGNYGKYNDLKPCKMKSCPEYYMFVGIDSAERMCNVELLVRLQR